MRLWKDLFPPGKVIPELWEYKDDDPNVVVVVDDQPITYIAQYTGISKTSERTIDTFLDQIGFGAPITNFDIWQKTHLHDSSRRSNNRCGIDMIVASSSVRTAHHGCVPKPRFTAGAATRRLMASAKDHFPDSALATCEEWAQPHNSIRNTLAAKVMAELKNRPALEELRPYIPTMEAFLNKPKTLAQIKEALSKGNIYRTCGKEALPKLSLTKALNLYVTWTSDQDHRLLTFLCRFPKHFVA